MILLFWMWNGIVTTPYEEEIKMRTFIIISIIIAILCFLCSCAGFGGRRVIYFDDTDIKATKRIKQIIKIINKEDKEAFKKLFSQKAIEEADGFDENLDHLFELFQGKIESWEKNSGPSVSKSSDYGHIIKNVSSYYYITTTDGQKYFFLLDDFPIDTDHPDNVGLFLLIVAKAEDSDKIFDDDQKVLYDGDTALNPSGICIPFD